MAMTKIDIVQNVSDTLGIFRNSSTRIVESVFKIMKEQISKGDAVKISGFGNFLVRSKNARRGRKPQTGNEMEISARKIPKFKSSQILRKALNGNSSEVLK